MGGFTSIFSPPAPPPPTPPEPSWQPEMTGDERKARLMAVARSRQNPVLTSNQQQEE